MLRRREDCQSVLIGSPLFVIGSGRLFDRRRLLILIGNSKGRVASTAVYHVDRVQGIDVLLR